MVQAGGVFFFLVVWVFLDTVKQQLPQPLLKALKLELSTRLTEEKLNFPPVAPSFQSLFFK